MKYSYKQRKDGKWVIFDPIDANETIIELRDGTDENRAKQMAIELSLKYKNKRDKHSHYFKDVSHLNEIDVYQVLYLFGVTDPCIAHAAKKIALCR